MRAAETAAAPARLLPSGDAYFLLDGAERELLVPARGSAGAALDAPRLAGRAARRRRDPRHLEAGAAHRADRRLVAPVAPTARDAIEAEAAALPLPGIDRAIEVVWNT